jgi:hypothetical protein
MSNDEPLRVYAFSKFSAFRIVIYLIKFEWLTVIRSPTFPFTGEFSSGITEIFDVKLYAAVEED